MAKSTKPAVPQTASQTEIGVSRAKQPDDIQMPAPQVATAKKPRATTSEPALPANAAPTEPEVAPNRRAARTPLDELDPTLVHVGRVVRKARKAKDLTQLQLAKILGINSAAIFMVEAGRQNMTIKGLMALAAKLDLQVGDLFPRSTPRTAAKLTELRDVIGDVKDRVQAQLRLLERVSKELDEEAGNLD